MNQPGIHSLLSVYIKMVYQFKIGDIVLVTGPGYDNTAGFTSMMQEYIGKKMEIKERFRGIWENSPLPSYKLKGSDYSFRETWLLKRIELPGNLFEI